jgi:hypothetical protein
MAGWHDAGPRNDPVPLLVEGDPRLGFSLGFEIQQGLMNAIGAYYADIKS